MYLTNEIVIGGIVEQWFDITEYESATEKTRRHNPLKLFEVLDLECLKFPSTEECIKSKHIEQWITARLGSNVLPGIIWGLYRILLGVIFIMAENKFLYEAEENNLQELNSTLFNITADTKTCFQGSLVSHNLNMLFIWVGVLFIISLHWLISFVKGIIEGLFNVSNMYKATFRLPTRDKSMLAVCLFLIFGDALFFGTLLVFVPLKILNLYNIVPISDFADNTFFLLICGGMVLSFAQLTQLSPNLADFQVTLERLVSTSIVFLGSLATALLPMSNLINRVSNRGKLDCKDTDNNLFSNWYNTFLALVNLFDFDLIAKHASSQGDELFLKVAHVIFVAVFVIIMMNYLIALYGKEVDFVEKYADVIIPVQRIHFILSKIEPYFKTICPWWYKKTKPYFFNMHKGRVYVTRLIVGRKTNDSTKNKNNILYPNLSLYEIGNI